MKRTKQRKLLAVLLAITMLTMTMLPSVVFAEDSEPIGFRENSTDEVGTETALRATLTDISGEKTIIITNDIVLSSGIAITGTGNVTIQGKTGNETIRAAENSDFSSNAHGGKGPNMFLIVGDNDITVTLENITIDGNKDNGVTARPFQIGGGSASSYQLSLGQGAILKNAYTNESGGGVFVRKNARLTIEGGCIQNCISDSYGGGVQVSGENATLIMNSGLITGNLGTYAGGICYYGGVNSKVELYGGSIMNNTVLSTAIVRPGGLFINGRGMYIGGDIRICGNHYKITDSSTSGYSDVATNGDNILQIAKPFTGQMGILVRRGSSNTIGIDLVHVKGTDNHTIQESDLQGLSFSDISNDEYMFYLNTSENEVVCKKANLITFNANTGDDAVTVMQQVPSGHSAMLKANSFTRSGYRFNGWNTEQNGSGTNYKDKDSITASSDMTLYAQWTEIVTVTITEADMAEISEDSTAIAAALTRQGISNIASIAALKVTTEGNAYLSPKDNMYLKENFTSLVYLDESECACSTRNLSESYLTKSGLPDEKYAEFGGLRGFSSLSTLIIPNEAQVINSYQVDQTGLTRLTIPNNVLVIESGAFSSNTALTADLIIPDSVILIGNNAFGAGTSEINCGKLTLGNSVKYIDNSAFTKRVFTGNLIIPDSVETIGNWAFGAGAFQNGTWTLGTGLRSVGDAAMSNICSGNEGTLFIPAQLVTKDTCFGYNTFSKVVFEEGITAIGTRVVRNSKNITTVILPTTLKSIGLQAFLSCSALENITLPYGLESIGNSAFEGTKISGIYIPDTVTQIGKVAFENLPQNSVLYAPNDAVYQLLIENNDTQWERRYDHTKTALAVTNGGTFAVGTAFESGKLANPTRKGYIFDGWYDNDSFTGDAVTAVEPGKTYYAKWVPSSGFCGDPAVNDGKDVTWSLDNITGTLTISGNGAMADYETNVVTGVNPSPWCWNRQHISKVVVEEGVTHIGDYAFASFSILKEVELADSVKSIGFNAFHTSGKSSATGFTVKFPEHLESIEKSAFTNSWLAGDIVLPASLTSIGDYAFKNVAKVSSIKTTSKTLYVGVSAFASNGNLNTVDWTSVETLTLPDASETNAALLFQGCKDTVVYVRDEATATKIIDLISSGYYSDVHLGTIAVTNGGTFADGTNHVSLQLTNPQKAGFVFDGWYKDSAFTIPATTVETYKTHYAKWTEKTDQVLSYANSTVEKHINDGAFTNELTKTTVDGEVTYTSSNPAVATVDDNGEVTIVGAGTATITATAAETDNYNSATAEYTLTVTAHRYTDVVTAPTCTEKGYTTHTCSECGDAYKDTYVDATDHSFTNYVSNNDATCTEDGTKTAVCDHGCGVTKTVTDAGSVKGHSWGEWETVHSPNCTDKGSEKRTCSECGAIETKDVDPNGHDWNEDFTVDKEATCTTDGSKSIHCKNCDAVKDSTAIPATEHAYDDSWKSDKNNHWQECTACGEKSEVAAHTFQWIIDKEASETEMGGKHEECAVCHYKKDAVEIPATGSTEPGDNENPSEPDTDAPETGYNSNLWIWISLLAASAAGMGITLVISKKRGEHAKIR